MIAVCKTFGVFFIFGLLTAGVFGIRDAFSPHAMLTIMHRAEELERLHESVLRRQERQYQAAQEWMTQRCTWEEAMQRLQELDEDIDQAWPGFIRLIDETTPLSAEQRRYQLIFHYVKTVLSERPEELTVVLRRLEKDSQQLHTGCPKGGTATKDG